MEAAFRAALYRALAAKVTDLGGIAHAVGGTSDHMHLVASVPPRMALSTFVGQVKGNASHFVNYEIRPGFPFYWQDEYGVVSFGEGHLPWVVRYARDQERRHVQGTVERRLERADG